MFENMINKKVKCVWQDVNSKAAYGIVEAINDKFISLNSQEGFKLHISIEKIISIKEVE